MTHTPLLLVVVLTLVAAVLMFGFFRRRCENVELRRSRLKALDRVKPAGNGRRLEP